MLYLFITEKNLYFVRMKFFYCQIFGLRIIINRIKNNIITNSYYTIIDTE